MSTDPTALTRLEELNTLWRYHDGGPHVVYTQSGKHGDFYFNPLPLTSDAEELEGFLRAYILPQLHRTPPVGAIISYQPHGMPVAKALAKCLRADSWGFDLAKPVITPRKGKVLVTAEDIDSGTSIRKTITLAEKCGVKVVADLIVIVNLTGSKVFDGRRIISAIEPAIHRWEPDECPLCRAGSVAIPRARVNWERLTGKE